MPDREHRALAQHLAPPPLPTLPLPLLHMRARRRRLTSTPQLIDGQRALAPIELRNALYDGDRVLVAPAPDEEPRALLEREDEEAERPEEERHPAEREEEVPPAHVVRAAAGRRVGRAGEVRDERPCELGGAAGQRVCGHQVSLVEGEEGRGEGDVRGRRRAGRWTTRWT